MAFGVKTNERPGTRAQVRYVADVGLQGPRGARPHPRQGRAPRPTRSSQFTERDVARSSSARCLDSAVANAEHNDEPGPRGALRVGLLRRRGPDAQALAPPGPWPGHPHPQAHLPHHGHRQPHARRRARAAGSEPQARHAGRAAAARPRPSPPRARRRPPGPRRPSRRRGRRADRPTSRSTDDRRPRSTRPRTHRVDDHERRRPRPTTATTRPTRADDDGRGPRARGRGQRADRSRHVPGSR